MSTAGISALSSLSQTPDTTMSSSQQAAKTLAQLLKDIESGNTSNAQQDLATLNQQLGSSQSSAQNSPLGELLAQLKTDLGSGNIAAAQTDVQNFLASIQNGSSSNSTSNATNQTGSATPSNSIGDALKQDFLTLLQSVQSGDLSSAQSAYNSLTGLLSQKNNAPSGAGSGVQSTASSTQTDPFQTLIDNLGSALSSGNLSAAQQALQAFFQAGQSNGVFVTINA